MEHDWLALQKLVHRDFAKKLALITDWDAPTPDTEWRVRDLVAHVITEQQWVPSLLAGLPVAIAAGGLQPIRTNDLLAEWDLYSLAATSAWENTAQDKLIHLANDTVTMAEYLREQVSDVAIHSWDLARAIGADEALDDRLVAAVWTVFEPQADALTASGLYAAPTPIPDDAPLQQRLLALTGRDPR